jgi:O-antigen ligase
MQLAMLIMPINTLVGCLTVLVIAIGIWRDHANYLVQNLVNQGLLLLGCWMVILALFAQSRAYALEGLVNFLPFFIVFIAHSRLIQTPQQLRRMAWIWIIPSFVIVLLGLGQLYSKWYFHWKFLAIDGSDGILLDWTLAKGGEPIGRMSSLFYYATVLASYFTTTFTLSLGLLIEQLAIPPKRIPVKRLGKSILIRLILMTLTGLNLVGLFLTNSRNAWGLAIVICLAFATYRGWRWMVALASWLIIAVLESAYGPVPLRDWARAIVPRMIWARINDDLFLNRPIASLRTTQWQFAWRMIQERPLTGWGLRNFTPLYQAKMNYFIGHPHNLPLMLSAEIGVPAALIFYVLIGWVLYGVVQWLRQNHAGQFFTSGDRTIVFTYLIAFLACTLFSLFDVTFFEVRINTMQWLLLAAIWGVVLNTPALVVTQSAVTQSAADLPPIGTADEGVMAEDFRPN